MENDTPKQLTPQAQRALAEAAERRAAFDKQAAEQVQKTELDGRGGLDPVRYNDWEIKGIACDFS
jgi:hypothetical protein